MSTHRRPRANAIALTASALLGLGMLAGCTAGGGSASPSAASAPAASAPAMSAPRLFSAALAALRAGGSVHVDITANALPGAKLVLYVADDPGLRPVRYELVGGGSIKNTISFSRWGERLSLTAPENAVPASSLTSGTVTA